MRISVAAKIKAHKRAAMRIRTQVCGNTANRIYVPIAPIRQQPVRLRITIGPDTRDLTGKIMGDPLPGRSALNHRSPQ